MSREANKQRLKQNVISRNDVMGEGKRHPSLLVYVITAFSIAAFIYGAYYYTTCTMRSDYSVSWQVNDKTEDGEIETFRGFREFAGGIIKYTKDGAEYVDKKGSVVWERSYQLNAPIIDTGDEYAVIADQGATSIYIFNNSEVTGVSETILPISLVKISDTGIVYAVLNDSDAEYITAFRPDGSAIDLSVKSIVNGDGYPFDIDTSPDGTELITSYAGIEGGKIANSVVFRNFGSVGQNADARRVVGGFKDEFAGHMTGRVHFSTNEYSQAFYDGGIVFFSTKVLNSPEVLKNVVLDRKMLAIAYNDKMTAVLLDNGQPVSDGNAEDKASENTSGSSKSGKEGTDKENKKAKNKEAGNKEDKKTKNEKKEDASDKKEISTEDKSQAPYTLIILDNAGNQTGSADIDISYKDICISKNTVIVYGSKDIRAYSAKGTLRGDLSFEDGEISKITGSDKDGMFYAVTSNAIMQIRY